MNEKLLKVLIVEEDGEDARMLTDMIRWTDVGAVQLLHAENAGQALELLARDGVDAAVMRLQSESSDGLEDLELVKAKAPRTPVIVIAMPEEEALANEAVRRGADDYLLKWQFDSRCLQRCLSSAMQRRRRAESLAKAQRLEHERQPAAPRASEPSTAHLREPVVLIQAMTESLLQAGLSPEQESLVRVVRGAAMAMHSIVRAGASALDAVATVPEARAARGERSGRRRSSHVHGRAELALAGSVN